MVDEAAPPGLTKNYSMVAFATADDIAEANGSTILSHRQALKRAAELAGETVEAERIAALGGPLTVSEAIDDYVAEREARHDLHGLAGARGGPRSRLARVLAANPTLGDTPLAAAVALLAAVTIDIRTRHDLGAALRRPLSAISNGCRP